MPKYYRFCYDAGYAGSENAAVYQFPDDVPEGDVPKAFGEWYEAQRTDCGSCEEISEEEAQEAGIDVDYKQ